MRRNRDPETDEFKQEVADVCIVIPSTTNPDEKDAVIVPQSFLPIDLTEYVTLKDALNSRSFLKAVREGLIAIVDDATADELYHSEGADYEISRLAKLRDKVREATTAPTPKDNDINTPKEEKTNPEDEFDPQFVAKVLLWSTQDSDQILRDFRAYHGLKYSRKQLNFILSKLDAVKHRKVIAHIKDKMNAHKG
jgi:hypothetical protein